MKRKKVTAAEKRAGEFVSVVSHDLKNPLASIKLYVELAKKAALDVKSAEIAEYLIEIDRQNERAITLVSELLDSATLSTGELTLYTARFRFDELLRQVVKDFRNMDVPHSIEINGTGSIFIQGDREKIRRVIVNLLSNAIKYSPKANRIVVTYKKDGGDGNAVLFSVKDFGVGIPPREHVHLFDLYFRVKEGKNIAKGHGLGLPIVKRIIEAHNGEVWVESAQGKGSTFFVLLPCG